jgi:hypothetical protein
VLHLLSISCSILNIGLLGSMALSFISDDVDFNPSTQRHYRRLIYYLYIHSYMFRSYDHHQAEKHRRHSCVGCFCIICVCGFY